MKQFLHLFFLLEWLDNFSQLCRCLSHFPRSDNGLLPLTEQLLNLTSTKIVNKFRKIKTYILIQTFLSFSSIFFFVIFNFCLLACSFSRLFSRHFTSLLLISSANFSRLLSISFLTFSSALLKFNFNNYLIFSICSKSFLPYAQRLHTKHLLPPKI